MRKATDFDYFAHAKAILDGLFQRASLDETNAEYQRYSRDSFCVDGAAPLYGVSYHLFC